MSLFKPLTSASPTGHDCPPSGSRPQTETRSTSSGKLTFTGARGSLAASTRRSFLKKCFPLAVHTPRRSGGRRRVGQSSILRSGSPPPLPPPPVFPAPTWHQPARDRACHRVRAPDRTPTQDPSVLGPAALTTEPRAGPGSLCLNVRK